MLDIKLIKKDPSKYDEMFARRGYEEHSASDLLQAYDKWRAIVQDKENLEREHRAFKAETASDRQVAHERREKIAGISKLCSEAQDFLKGMMMQVPNELADDVPEGSDASGNIVVETWGRRKKLDFTAKTHFDIFPNITADGASLSGSRFALLKGPLARLSRILQSLFIESHVAHGYEEIEPPYLVNREIMEESGQLPKFADQAFYANTGHWLIPTSEVSLVGMIRGKKFASTELPKRWTAVTPCFRSEAGAAGRDTKGLIRLHQFMKVEMVAVTTAENSDEMHMEMLERAKSVLRALDIPHRVVLLCGGDIGFGARKTYDLEVWMPGAGKYCEISSCSNCGDFQSRRLGAKVDGKLVHTLNGSGVAIGRAIAAIIENYQNPDGTITVPNVIKDSMGMENFSA